jgi:hypothetical protein
MSASAYDLADNGTGNEAPAWKRSLDTALGIGSAVSDLVGGRKRANPVEAAPTPQKVATAKPFEIFGQPWYVAVGVAACLGALAWLLFRK